MSEFKKFYVFAMNAKFYMAIYFVATLFIVSIVTLIFGGESVSILTLFEMLFVNMVSGFLQAIMLKEGTDYSKGIFFGRSILWLIISVGITTLTAVLFGWFKGYPSYCILIFILFMLFGFCTMLYGLKFEQDADTVHLNSQLDQYKNTKN